MVINFEKIGPDPPPTTEKCDDGPIKDEANMIKDADFSTEQSNLNEKYSAQSINQPPNTSWYTCRKMIYVPKTSQKGYPLGNKLLAVNTAYC